MCSDVLQTKRVLDTVSSTKDKCKTSIKLCEDLASITNQKEQRTYPMNGLSKHLSRMFPFHGMQFK